MWYNSIQIEIKIIGIQQTVRQSAADAEHECLSADADNTSPDVLNKLRTCYLP